MNLLAKIWAMREAKRIQRDELSKLVSENRELSLAVQEARLKYPTAQTRQDGPGGFVLVDRESQS